MANYGEKGKKRALAKQEPMETCFLETFNTTPLDVVLADQS